MAGAGERRCPGAKNTPDRVVYRTELNHHRTCCWLKMTLPPFKASDDERADMFSTRKPQTFSRSAAGFCQNEGKNEKLELLKSRLEEQAPLSPEVRAEKELDAQVQTDNIKAQGESETGD